MHNSKTRCFRSTGFVLFLLISTPSMLTHAASLEVVVPAYFYPTLGTEWNQLAAVANEVPITAILDPDNGPGASVDPNYVAAVNNFRAAGGRVLGYVYTSYGTRSQVPIFTDIENYKLWYNVDGIFVDEMANDNEPTKLNYYRDIYNWAKAHNPNWQVMGNPGTNTVEQYLTWPAADRLITQENTGALYPSYEPAAWTFNYPTSRFVHLLHTEPSAAAMLSDLQRALAFGAGAIYITDDVLANPWDQLPSYWSQFIAGVMAINADYNYDGTVDAADYVVWRQTLGEFGTFQLADGNGDGVVTTADFNVWRAAFGASSINASGSTAEVLAVPEPTMLMLMAAMFWLLFAPIARNRENGTHFVESVWRASRRLGNAKV